MKQILLSLSILFLLSSSHVFASQCTDGKMTIKEWIKEDGTYLDYNLPKQIFNSKACFLKPYEGNTLQSKLEFQTLIKKTLYTYRKREVSLIQFTKVLEVLGNNFDIYLIKPCDFGLNPMKDCENSTNAILGFVSEGIGNPSKKAFTSIDTTNYLEEANM